MRRICQCELAMLAKADFFDVPEHIMLSCEILSALSCSVEAEDHDRIDDVD